MGQKKAASFAELDAADGIEYAYVDAYGVTVRIGSLTSGDMIEWAESNDDPNAKREAGLRLLVKSVVDEDGHRLPGLETKEGFDKQLAAFRRKGTVGNNRVIEAALTLNGLQVAGGKRPNDSSETATDSFSTGSEPSLEK